MAVDQPCVLPPEAMEILRRVGEVRIPSSFERDEFVELARGAHALLSWSGVPVSAAVLESASRLEVVSVAAVGYDHVDVEAATRLGVVVANQPGAGTDSVAEWTVFLIIGLLRNAMSALQATKAGQWLPLTELEGRELRGQRVGVIGLGRIGSRVAALLGAFGCEILGYDPHLSAERWPEHVTRVSLADLLEKADVVTLHVPLTPETSGLLGREQLAHLKRGAYLVNTARAGVVDEEALVESLRSGHLGGAAIDVFPEEPPNLSCPLYRLPNVIVSPHMAALTREALRRYAEGAAQAIYSVLVERRWPATAVNKCDGIRWRFLSSCP